MHCDTGALPDARGNSVCNVLWMLDDFTPENGATRFVPGTHRSGRLPQDVLADASAPHPDERLLLGRRGTIVVMNAHMWHGGTANRSDGSAARAPQLLLPARSAAAAVSEETAARPRPRRRSVAELRWLLALDDPLNDEISARASGKSGFLK